MTVLEVIQKSAEFLSRKAVGSPRLHAELLLAHVLGLPRMRLYLEFDRVITPAQADTMRELVRRRGTREPLQHIVGSTSFCGLEILVNRHALIPRPETELLAERSWQFLNALAANGIPNPRALDLGTGTGCIAIAIAANCPTAMIVAVDVSPEALALASANAAKHGLQSRIQVLRSDGLEPVACGLAAPSKFHLLVSNPPYIPAAEIASLDPEVRDFDPRLALDGGADGMDWYRRLAREASPLLEEGGRMMLEFGDGQAEAISQILRQENWVVEQVSPDYTQRPRFLVARRE